MPMIDPLAAWLEATPRGRCDARDILLITDGLSHALDVQRLARAGRRISAVLIGAGSLEANIGHLAALAGGEIFISDDADLAAALGRRSGGIGGGPAGASASRAQPFGGADRGIGSGRDRRRGVRPAGRPDHACLSSIRLRRIRRPCSTRSSI